jgi:hypothetical protein
MRFLLRTKHQFYISTHSPTVIDAVPCAIHRVQKSEGETVVTSVNLASKRHAAVSELGHRPSDLVQTNFIIWVEGPSDKIYLQRWIKSIDNEFIEGIDFSILFYGGAFERIFLLGTTHRGNLLIS